MHGVPCQRQIDMFSIPPQDITGLVLAGGQGRRMGGHDKGLIEVHGQPLAAWTLARLAQQTGAQAISANRHLEVYRRLGVPVWADEAATDRSPEQNFKSFNGEFNGEFNGPLAGMAVGLAHCTTPYMAVVPCDSPCFPTDLVTQLARGLLDADADLALGASVEAGQPRLQPVFCLLRSDVLPDLRQFLAGGERKVMGWMQQRRHAVVPFDDAQAFSGANTPQELAALALRLR